MNKPLQWNELTPSLQKEFLMDGVALFQNWYFDDSKGNPKKFTIDDFVRFSSLIKNRKCGDSYGNTDLWLYEALESISIDGLSAAIMGSTVPWYESIAIEYGAHPTTIEYNLPNYNNPLIKEIRVSDFWNSPIEFDVGFSISSFEHDGLGRYGDPINPNGDLRAMGEMRKIIKKNGILFLAVPIGLDSLVWNAHRIYGEHRLQKLIDGWEVIGTVGLDQEQLRVNKGVDGSYQPIIVLKNT